MDSVPIPISLSDCLIIWVKQKQLYEAGAKSKKEDTDMDGVVLYIALGANC